MFNLGMPELILIFVVALLVFGPKRLPELGKSLGRAMSEFKRATNEIKDNFENEVGTAQIKEDLLKQQREVQASLTAPAPEAVPAAAATEAAAPTATTAAATTETTTATSEEKKKSGPDDLFKSYAG